MKNKKDKKKTNNSMIQLSNGRYVHIDIFDIVRMYVEERIPVLSLDKSYTLKQICGDENWNKLSKVNKIDAGYCMVHLVEKGELPFKAAKGKGDNHKRYRLK